MLRVRQEQLVHRELQGLADRTRLCQDQMDLQVLLVLLVHQELRERQEIRALLDQQVPLGRLALQGLLAQVGQQVLQVHQELQELQGRQGLRALLVLLGLQA